MTCLRNPSLQSSAISTEWASVALRPGLGPRRNRIPYMLTLTASHKVLCNQMAQVFGIAEDVEETILGGACRKRLT